MKNIIFTANRAKGVDYLKEIIGKMPYESVKKISEGSFWTFAELTDGTTYEVRGASDSSRGCKCDKAYVDRDISKEFIENIIYPCLCMSTLPYEEMVVYY